MMVKMLIPGLCAIIGSGFTVNVSATDLTCSDITFSPKAIAIYESIDKACLEMVDRDGKTYASLSAWVVAQTRTGTHVRFLYRSGKHGPAYKAEFPADFEIVLSDKAVRLEDLAIRQDINIYISEQYWSAPQNAPEPAAAESPVPGPKAGSESG